MCGLCLHDDQCILKKLGGHRLIHPRSTRILECVLPFMRKRLGDAYLILRKIVGECKVDFRADSSDRRPAIKWRNIPRIKKNGM